MVLHEPLYDSKWIKQQRGNKELKSDYSLLFKKKKSRLELGKICNLKARK